MIKEAIERIFELGGNFKPQTAADEGDPFIIIPQNMRAENIAATCPPKRIKQTPEFQECGSFVEYVNRFKNKNTLIFAGVSESSAAFRAVLDYHGPGSPAYCHHSAHFNTRETVEWRAWQAANRKSMNQVEFATWLEDNTALFQEPAGADLLELVRSLHGHKNARFNTALRLDNGAYSVGYEEEVVIKGASTAKSGAIDLPPVVIAGIAPFQGAEKYEVRARLKSRVQDRALLLWFETIAPHLIVRDSILRLVEQISEQTKIIPLIGVP